MVRGSAKRRAHAFTVAALTVAGAMGGGCGVAERPPPALGDWWPTGGAQDSADSSATEASTGRPEIDPATDSASAGSGSGGTLSDQSSGSTGRGSSTGGREVTSGSEHEGTTGRASGTVTEGDEETETQMATTTAATSSGTTSDTGGPQGTFSPALPFGDDQAELDLVGAWGVPRYGDPQTWEARLEIDVDGSFDWQESDPLCELVTLAHGVVWVENNQLVLHYETFEGDPPWPTQAAIGLTVTAPFRARFAYAPAGTTLAVAAPSGFTSSAPWAGVALLRQTATSGPKGTWMHESQLEALVPGEMESQVILVDRYQAELRADGTGLRSLTRAYYWPTPFSEPTIYADAPWVDGTPGNSAGAVTVGGRPFAYDTVRLHSFGQWDALRADPQMRCQ